MTDPLPTGTVPTRPVPTETAELPLEKSTPIVPMTKLPARARSALRALTRTATLLAFLVLTGCSGPNLVDRATDPFAYGFCGLVILILDVIAVVEVLNSDWSAGSKLLWILLILLAPILGLILYYVFARED